MNYIALAFQLLPAILQAVQEVQKLNIPGTSKRDLIVGSLDVVSSIGEKVTEKHIALVSGLINYTVAALNNAGIFTHSTAPASQTTVNVAVATGK